MCGGGKGGGGGGGGVEAASHVTFAVWDELLTVIPRGVTGRVKVHG